jgi:hypothetical protein
MAPDRMIVPGNHERTSRSRAKGLSGPAWPPAPDQAVDALFRRLLGVALADDVVKHHAAVGMHRLDHVLGRPQAGDDDRDLVLDTGLHVGPQAFVGGVTDLVDRERRHFLVRVVGGKGAELGLDPRDPLAERRLGPRVERREGADDAGLALGDDQLGPRDDKHRRADNRQP